MLLVQFFLPILKVMLLVKSFLAELITRDTTKKNQPL